MVKIIAKNSRCKHKISQEIAITKLMNKIIRYIILAQKSNNIANDNIKAMIIYINNTDFIRLIFTYNLPILLLIIYN